MQDMDEEVVEPNMEFVK